MNSRIAKPDKSKLKRAVFAACLVTGAVFTVIGIAAHQQISVLAKAVRICLECIGIA